MPRVIPRKTPRSGAKRDGLKEEVIIGIRHIASAKKREDSIYSKQQSKLPLAFACRQ
jgi:hypothetical protein